MSRSLARLNSSTRSIQSIPSGSVLAPPRTPVLRRWLYASARSRPRVSRCGSSVDRTSYIITRHNRTAVQEDDLASEPNGSADIPPNIPDSSTSGVSVPKISDSDSERTASISRQDEEILDSRFARHLNEQFSPLKFPPELARRILTHGSHRRAAIDGHNARLGFIGRRVLNAYLTMFLHSSSASDPKHDYDMIIARTLNTYGLGQFVAPKWYLGRVLRWQPTIDPRAKFNYEIKNRGNGSGVDVDPELAVALRAHPNVARGVGLYKVMGEAVQAIVGGAYHQFGASVTHRIFHTRILPHLLINGPLGLHEAYHADAYNKGKSLAARGLVRTQGHD